MECILGAELVNFVMNLIKHPGFIIVDRVVLDSVMNIFSVKPVDHFYLIKMNHSASTRSTRDVGHLVSLNSHLDIMDACN